MMDLATQRVRRNGRSLLAAFERLDLARLPAGEARELRAWRGLVVDALIYQNMLSEAVTRARARPARACSVGSR